MRRGDRAGGLPAIAFCACLCAIHCVSYATARSPALELRGTGRALYMDLDGGGRNRIGIDGLAATAPHGRPKRPGPVLKLEVADSVALALALPAAGEEPALRKLAPPCSLLEFSRERGPGTLYDVMLFGDAANQPWVRLRCGDTSGWARLPDLRLRKADPDRRIPFSDPAILRSPFLVPLLQTPLAPESVRPARSYRWSEGSPAPVLSDSKADSIAVTGWNWSIVRDDPDGGRQRVDARNAAGGRPIWFLAGNGSGRIVTFEESYRREPRRVESFVSPRSHKPFLVFEVATLFGDGVWTDLWVAGPDTLWTRRIGERNGETGADAKSGWTISPGAGTVSVKQAGRPKTVFRAP